MNLAERLLDPEKVEAALEWLQKNAGIPANTIVMPYPEALKTCTSAIRELHARLAAARADLEDISDAFPDDATHKHEVTGESLVDNVRDALRDLAKAKADLAAARAGGTR